MFEREWIVSAEKEPQTENEEEEAAEPTEEGLEKERPAIIKKKRRKGKFIMETTPEADEEQLLMEITELLKRARVALVNKNYLEAVKSYQDAAIAANMAGDTERERIFLRRMNEILKDHPELVEEEGFKIIKKRRIKAKLREEEGFSLSRLISNVFVALLMLIFVYSGLLGSIVLYRIFDVTNVNLLWGLSIFIEILGLIIAYLLGTRWLRWSE